EAREALHAARDVFGEHRQRVWEGLTCLRLAEAELAAERPAQAAELAEQALGYIGVTEGEQRRGTVLTVLGRALDALGQPDRARTCWQEALRIFEDWDAAGYEEVRGLLGHTAATARRTRPRQGGHRP
ncbi:tetratricopeptide repeat protein, partial [Streptomyces sp. SID2955]|nr:tetratricopeptide repeat protein [Streptomyces sp. SID2955]